MGNFLLGLGIGMTVGVLFAPKPGADTRGYITSKASETTDYLAKQGQELKDSASEMMERGKQAVMSQKEKLASTLQNSGKQLYER